MDKPLLLIINGLPGTGKTTLAEYLSKELSLPLFAKDAFKELFFTTLGVKDRAWSMILGKVAIESMLLAAESALKGGVSCMIESPFQPHFGQKDIEGLLSRVPARVVQVFCSLPPEVRIERMLTRVRRGERHEGHQDPTSLTSEEYAVLYNTLLDPMDLDAPLLEFSPPKSVEELLHELRPHL